MNRDSQPLDNERFQLLENRDFQVLGNRPFQSSCETGCQPFEVKGPHPLESNDFLQLKSRGFQSTSNRGFHKFSLETFLEGKSYEKDLQVTMFQEINFQNRGFQPASIGWMRSIGGSNNNGWRKRSSMSESLAFQSLERLPDSCLARVFSFLQNLKDLAAISATCVRFYQVSSSSRKQLKLVFNPGDDMVRTLFFRFTNLSVLELPLLHNGKGFTDSSCQVLASAKFPLVSLNLEKQSNITDIGIMAIANSFPQLEELFLNGCLNVTDEGLCAIAYSCRNLRALHSRYCRSLTSASLRALCASCPSMSVLEISANGNFGGKWPQLQELSVTCNACECSDALQAISCNFPQLTSLSLQFCKLGEGHHDFLSRSRFLKKMVLESCTDLPSELFSCSWPNLSVLHIRTSTIDDTTLATIARGCQSLCEIKLLSCADITDDGVIKIASSCSMLKVLDVHSCPRVTHAELVVCAVGLSPVLVQIGLPRQCFGAKHLKAVSRHGWFLETGSSQWQLLRKKPCSCSLCTSKRVRFVQQPPFLSWIDR